MNNLIIVYVYRKNSFFLPEELKLIEEIFINNQNNLNLATKITKTKFENDVKITFDEFEINKNKKFTVQIGEYPTDEKEMKDFLINTVNDFIENNKNEKEKLIIVTHKNHTNKINYI